MVLIGFFYCSSGIFEVDLGETGSVPIVKLVEDKPKASTHSSKLKCTNGNISYTIVMGFMNSCLKCYPLFQSTCFPILLLKWLRNCTLFDMLQLAMCNSSNNRSLLY